MNKLPWLPFYGRDFFCDEAVALMSMRQVGIYLVLLWHQWEEGSIPSAVLCQALPRLNHDEMDWYYGTREPFCFATDIEHVHEHCFLAVPGASERFVNPRLATIRAEQEREHQRKVEGGRKGGLAQAQLKHSLSIAQAQPLAILKQSESDSKTEAEKKKTKSVSVRDFDAFWEVYPKKIGKQAAMKAWTLAAARPSLDHVLLAIAQATQSEMWRKDAGKYIPHPATWLNQGRWDDVHPLNNGHRTTPPPPPPKSDPIGRGQWGLTYGDPKQYGYE